MADAIDKLHAAVICWRSARPEPYKELMRVTDFMRWGNIPELHPCPMDGILLRWNGHDIAWKWHGEGMEWRPLSEMTPGLWASLQVEYFIEHCTKELQ